jgi:hypothetical protein
VLDLIGMLREFFVPFFCLHSQCVCRLCLDERLSCVNAAAAAAAAATSLRSHLAFIGKDAI